MLSLRKLGSTSLQIPPIAFGGNVLGWTADQDTSFALLDALFERGFNYVDTANLYSRWVEGHTGGESETILGRWMHERDNRDRMVIATKVGMDVGQGHPDLSPEHIATQIELSLERLQTDYVDVYFSHQDDERTPVQATLEAYQQLIEANKVRHIGASNFSLARLQESIAVAEQHALPRYQVYQPEYSLMKRDEFEGEVRDFCVRENISVTSYFTLASGFLTGKYRTQEDTEGKARGSRVSKFFNPRGERVLAALRQTAEELNISPAGVALAWTMNQPGITAPIASATKTSHLQAFDEAVATSLSEEQTERLTSASVL